MWFVPGSGGQVEGDQTVHSTKRSKWDSNPG